MEGTTLPPDWAGAYVNVYLGAGNLIEAIQNAESALLVDRYRPISTYAAWEVDLEELSLEQSEKSEEQSITVSDFENLCANGGVMYSGFAGFRPEDVSVQ